MIAIGFLVAAGAGAAARWRLGVEYGRLGGTFVANLLGAFIVGLLVGQGDGTQTVVGIAGLGALTTWSALISELVELAIADRRRALLYGGLSIVLGVFAAWLGLQMA
ncbi:MAG: CrcB family protein [Actinomycetota bacterium]